jgi:NAD(P)-dependent dehydrogenase (short-subunit alcohol dehydrogenase family)
MPAQYEERDTEMQSLKDKVVLVTGAGRGLGAAICDRLSQDGATLIVADFKPELAKEVAGRARDRGAKASPLHLDVLQEDQVEECIERAVKELGKIDVLVNNAGVDVTVSIEEMSVEDWDRVLGTNLRGPFVLSKFVFPHMKKQRSGHILNIVSTAAKRAWPNASAYHASKWGLLGLSHALHTEARPHNIKVTAMLCGGMRTPFLLDRFPDIDLETLQDPKDVAETVRYVLSAPAGTVIPEVMAIPMKETSWP